MPACRWLAFENHPLLHFFLLLPSTTRALQAGQVNMENSPTCPAFDQRDPRVLWRGGCMGPIKYFYAQIWEAYLRPRTNRLTADHPEHVDAGVTHNCVEGIDHVSAGQACGGCRFASIVEQWCTTCCWERMPLSSAAEATRLQEHPPRGVHPQVPAAAGRQQHLRPQRPPLPRWQHRLQAG